MGRSLYAQLDQRYAARDGVVSRRAVLAGAVAASAGLLLSCATGGARRDRQGRRVVVVGAGFGGLAAAYELRSAGYDVRVVEARRRIGGRVLSFNGSNGNTFVPGRNVEGGGELIGTNHPTWQAYARRFGLRLIDVTESEAAGPVVLQGRALSAAEGERLYHAMGVVLEQLTAASARVDAARAWQSEGAAELDATSMGDWLAGARADALVLHAVRTQLEADNAVALERQSLLGLLAAVKGGGGETYWTESETHRCEGGNQRLAFALAEQIGAGRIALGTPVTAIDRGERVARVVCADGAVLECDDVVLAVPPSVWGGIDFRPELPAELRPQMGVATKYIAHVRGRFWNAARSSPDGFSDGVISETWEGTDNQAGDGPAALAGFSGGPAAERLRGPEGGRRAAEFAMGALHEGFVRNLVADRFMDWPGTPWTGGGYSFPAPGEVTRVAPLLHAGFDRLHFAGEHACCQFAGYMEGGLWSGADLARRIAARDGIAKMPALSGAVRPLAHSMPAHQR